MNTYFQTPRYENYRRVVAWFDAAKHEYRSAVRQLDYVERLLNVQKRLEEEGHVPNGVRD